MKLRTHTLLMMLAASFSFVACDVEEVAGELAENENVQEFLGEEEQEDEIDLPEATLMALADLQEEEITQFSLCLQDVGEFEVPLEDSFMEESQEEEEVLEVTSETCEGSHSMVINGYYLEGDFDIEVDRETTGNDILDELFELVENDDECDEEDHDEESEIEDENDEEDEESEDNDEE